MPSRWPTEKLTPGLARRLRRRKSQRIGLKQKISDPIPAPKLVNVVHAHEDIVSTSWTAACPACRSPMRLGWSQRAHVHRELDFDRPLPPIGGSALPGCPISLAAPPFPPGLASDPTLFFGVWLSGDPEVVEISGGAQFGNKLPLTIADGKVGGNPGVYRVTTTRLRPLEGTIFSVTIAGPRLVLESDLFAHTSDPDAHHDVPPDTPPPASGGGPAVLYEAASVAIGASTGLIAGNVICPATGDLEFYFEGLTGTQAGRGRFRSDPCGKGTGRGVQRWTPPTATTLHGHAVNFARGQPWVWRSGANEHQLSDAGCPGPWELLLPHIP